MGRVQSVRMDVAVICALWLTLIATMLLLQTLGFDFGFDIWPMGEFRNWIEFLQDHRAFNAAKLFWAVDNRNALSPWWYIAAKPLIDATPAAPLILQLVAGLFVGITAYLLLAELTHSRCFALSVGSLSAIFIPNAYLSGVIWNFVGALGCTLLAIWFFARFCNDRKKSIYLSFSYLAWFVALSTYTIQIGAIGAIFFVSLRSRRLVEAWTRAVLGAGGDILPYAALLVLYLMIWVTASSAGVPDGLHFHFSFDALVRSITAGLWNDYYYAFWKWLFRAEPRLMALVFLFLAAGALMVLRAAVTFGIKEARPTIESLGFALLVGACIVAPTIMLESGSDIWTPGTRWPMLMQFTTPLIFCLATFGIMSALPARFWSPLWQAGTACAVAFGMLLVLGFNRAQVVLTRNERAFFSELRTVVVQDRASGKAFPRHYVIQLAKPAEFIVPIGRLADAYAHTTLARDVTFETTSTLREPSEDSTLLIWTGEQFARPLAQP